MQKAKKQHYVTRHYLTRFTSDGTHLFAYDRIAGRSFATRFEDAASESFFYDAPLDPSTSEPGERDPKQTLERRLSDAEDEGHRALDALIAGVEGNRRIADPSRIPIARYIALQVLRTKEAREGFEQIQKLLSAELRREKLAPNLEAWLDASERMDHAAIVQSQILLDGRAVEEIANVLVRLG